MGDIQKNSNYPKWLSMTNWHLLRAFAMNNDNKDICHLPLPKMELCAPVTANLQHPLRGIQGGERGTLCSRETGGIGF